MKSQFKAALTLLALLSVFVANSSYAVPQKFPACQKDYKFKKVDGSAGFFLNKDCTVAYVLPPVTGHMELSSVSPNINTQQCETLNNLARAQQKISDQIGRTWDRLDRLEAQTQKQSGMSSAFTDGSSFGGTSTEDESEDVELDSALLEEIKVQQNKLGELLNAAAELQKPYLGLEGATASILFTASTSDIIEKHQENNPEIQFYPMPLEAAYMSFVKKEDNSTAAPAILRSAIPGISKVPLHNGIVAEVDPDFGVIADSTGEPVIFGNSLSGQVVLSLAGACPFVDKKTGYLPETLTAKKIAAHFNAQVQYAYAVQAHRSYHAEYNLANFLKRIKKTTKRGGFFSSKTVNSLIEERDSKDWFKFESTSEDASFEYEEQMRQEVKAELIDRVLKQVVQTRMGDGVPAPDLIQPGANGAAAASNALKKCPNFYCQAGALGLDVLNATFGSETATNEFISDNDYWSIDDVKETKMLVYESSLGFTE